MDQGDKTIQELIASAERAEDEGAMIDALRYWRDVLDQDRDPVFLCRFGRVAVKGKQPEDARQAFLEALRLDPDLPYANECLAIWHRDHGNLEEAINYLNRSLAVKETAPTYTLRGAVQLQLGRVAAARESFSKAVNVDPRFEEAYYNLGMTFALEKPMEAVALLRKAVELDPEFAMAHCELGWVLRQLNRYAEAELHLRRSAELDDSDGLAHVYLGNLLWTKREFAAAEQEFRKAIEVWPDDSLPHWCLAHFHEHQGRPREAEFLYEIALQLDPDSPVANLRFGVFLKELGENAKAKVHFERALNSDPTYEDARTALAEIE
jgi:tetratricopeptide (TPR) repeat protein